MISARSGYRADIDGLRALAIIPVVLYHYMVVGFTGGFVGVDVFFVISGYLIIGHIADEIANSRFSLRAFYERRIRRIFPAILVVSLTTFLAALLLLAPGPMKELGSELVWSSYFSTNIWFMKKDGYFDGASIMRPLLHSWSLAVEEQFYIVIPLLLRAVKASRLGRHAVLVVFLILFTLSLGVSVVSASHWPSAGFYLLSSRAWELLCGGLLAVGRFPRCAAFVTEIVAFLGLAAVTTAILLYTGATPYPGSAALLPCLGATALIWAGDQRSLPFVSRLLAMPLPVWIGRISYPLYLWHWPLLVLARFALFHEPDLAERLGLIALSVVLAAATTAYVEQPIRSRRILRSQTPLLGAGIAVLLVLLTLGESAEKTHGFTNRFTGMAKAYLDQPIDQSERYCAVLPHVTMGTGTVCGVGDWRRPGQPDFVVWGDSHARVLIPVFDLLARRYNLHGEVLYHGGCEPLLGVSEPGVRGSECRDFNQTVARSLHLRPGATVFLAGLWGRIAEGREPYGICEGVSNDLGAVVDVVTGIAGANGSHQAFANGLERSLDLLHTLRTNPVLIQDNPCQFTEVPSALAMATAQHRSIAELREKRPVIDHVQAWVDAQFEQAAAQHRAVFLRTRDVLCNATDCPVEQNGMPLYLDSSHLSTAGALLLEPVLTPSFENISAVLGRGIQHTPMTTPEARRTSDHPWSPQ